MPSQEKSVLKHQTITFIEGASGSGKTRIGLELFRELERRAAEFKLDTVKYVQICPKDGTRSQRL